MKKLGKNIPQLVLILALSYLTLLVLLFMGVTPKQYDIEVGHPSPTLIKATKDTVDTVTTEANREKAANAVTPSYKSVDYRITAKVEGDLDDLLKAVSTLRNSYDAEKISTMTDEELAALNLTIGEAAQTSFEAASEEDVDLLGRACTVLLKREDFSALFGASDIVFDSLATDLRDKVERVLVASLPEGQEEATLRTLCAELIQEYGQPLANAGTGLVSACLLPNMPIDVEITEENRDRARESVEPVTVVKDEVIVSEGSIVTEAQYTMIASMGILRENSFDFNLIGGIALLLLVIMAALVFYLYCFSCPLLGQPGQVLLLMLILVLTVGLSLLMRSFNGYAMPLAMSVMLIAVLMDTPLALFGGVITALIGALLAPEGSNSMYCMAAMTVLSAPVITQFTARHIQRSATLFMGVVAMAFNAVVTLSFGMFASAEMHTVFINAAWAAGGGLISAVAATALQPLLEWMFNQPTAAKLVDLSNPEQKLLRRLQLETPGTYHHSIIVANLAEAACSAIGANGILARVGAYYHDIGKLRRPQYFKENQLGVNPHDSISPIVSAHMLSAHPCDGVQMAEKARLPKAVIDIIQQHHGDGLMKFFYFKACEQEGKELSTKDFRYAGPRPQSREAGIVMLADTVEAATRSIKEPNYQKIEEMIHKLVREKLNDGQLDCSHLTFNDLDTVCRVFLNVLTGVYHERIEYPDGKMPKREADAESGNAEAPKESAPTQETGKTKPQAEPAVAPVPEEKKDAPSVEAAPVPEEGETPAAPVETHAPIAPGVPVPPVCVDNDTLRGGNGLGD